MFCDGVRSVVECHYCTPGVKMTAKIDEETVLEPVVKPLNDTLFRGNTGSPNKIQC